MNKMIKTNLKICKPFMTWANYTVVANYLDVANYAQIHRSQRGRT